MKYIVIQKMIADDKFYEFPIIFPNALIHKDVAEAITRMKFLKNSFIAAAGEFTLHGAVGCSGRSETIGVGSRKETDERLIILNDYGAGINL